MPRFQIFCRTLQKSVLFLKWEAESSGDPQESVILHDLTPVARGINEKRLQMFWRVAVAYFEGIIVIVIDAAPPAPKPINSPAALKLSVSSTLPIVYRPVIRADISSHIPAISSFALSKPLFKAAGETVFCCSCGNGLLSPDVNPNSLFGRSKEGKDFPSLCPRTSPRLRSAFSARFLVLPCGAKSSDDLSLRPRGASALRSIFSGRPLRGLLGVSKGPDLGWCLSFPDRFGMAA